MGKGKLILICQSGGEFITKDDGTLSYEGGEANALNISHETLFDDLKLKLAEMSNLDQTTISIKYFLPGNRRNLITLRNDKDLKRMFGFHEDSVTADIFVSGKVGFDRGTTNGEASRGVGLKLAETINHTMANSAATQSTVPNVQAHAPHSNTIDDAVLIDTPVSFLVDANKTAEILSPSEISSFSPSSSEHGVDDFDYNPRAARNFDAPQGSDGIYADGSPADTVKKRRRTASRVVGAHGPTVSAASENDGAKRQRNTYQGRDTVFYGEDLEMNNLDNLLIDDTDLPENLVSSWADCITGVGQEFKSAKEFREALQKYAVAHHIAYKLKKNDSARVSGICVEEGCSWNIRACWVPASETFQIKKLNNTHTCDGTAWKNANPAKSLLVSIIKDKLRDSPNHKTKEIAKKIFEEYGLELKYAQVRRGMEGAREQLQEPYKESYNHLPWLCEKLVEINPGSFVNLITNDEKRLQRLFFSFRACIDGFQNGCRPILFLDATSLRSTYHETLLAATAVDADDGFFPVAFSIVGNEDEESWRWFLEQLKSVVSTPLPLTFVYDMEKGLKKHVLEVFHNAYNGYSIYHLVENFKRNLSGTFSGEGRGVLPSKVLAAARAVRPNGFTKITDQIKQISSSAYDWTIQIEPENWTSLSFKGETYNYISQDVAEPYTKLMDEVRDLKITEKIEALTCMTSEIMKTRHEESSKWTTKLTPSYGRKMQELVNKASLLRVFISSDVIFEVHDDSTHVVNIEKQECTCLEWKENELPCVHAVAALNYSRRNVYEYCSTQFTAETYRITYPGTIINPITEFDVPLLGNEDGGPNDVQVLPPSPLPNQRKKDQTKTDDPDKRTVTCSKCKQPGHNKASCKSVL